MLLHQPYIQKANLRNLVPEVARVYVLPVVMAAVRGHAKGVRVVVTAHAMIHVPVVVDKIVLVVAGVHVQATVKSCAKIIV